MSGFFFNASGLQWEGEGVWMSAGWLGMWCCCFPSAEVYEIRLANDGRQHAIGGTVSRSSSGYSLGI